MQQVGPKPRYQESVHLRWQPVHHRRGGEPDAHHRDSGDPPGGVHRKADEGAGDLKTHSRRGIDTEGLAAMRALSLFTLRGLNVIGAAWSRLLLRGTPSRLTHPSSP